MTGLSPPVVRVAARTDTTVRLVLANVETTFDRDELSTAILVLLDVPERSDQKLVDAGIAPNRTAVVGLAARLCIKHNIEP